MDRKAWIAIIICVACLGGYQYWYHQTYGEILARQVEEQRLKEAEAAAKANAEGGTQSGNGEVVVKSTPSISGTTSGSQTGLVQRPVEVDEEALQELVRELETVRAGGLEVDFVNVGGGMSEIRLLEHEAEGEERVTLNEGGTIPLGAIAGSVSELGQEVYQVQKAGNKILMEREDEGGLQVRKEFELPAEGAEEQDQYLTRIRVTFRNAGQETLSSTGYFIYLGTIYPIHADDLTTYTGLDYFAEGKNRFTDVNWFLPGRVWFIGSEYRSARTEFREEVKNLRWTGVKNQYFTSLLTLSQEVENGTVWGQRQELQEENEDARAGMSGALGLPGFSLAPGEEKVVEFSLYTGPNRYSWLKELGQEQERILRYGMFKIVSITLLNSMNGLAKIFGNYAVAIIVLTLIIKSLLFPLQNKATKSMRKMSALSPKMTELREKYKDDPQRMNQEVMKMYREYGVNPFGGCLPMLVQIPIFFGFYSMLGTAVELRDSRFLWVSDLSQPDTVIRLFDTIPINILPLLMAVTMVWQMRITPKSGDAMQQRIFMFIPLIFVIFCYNFASALALYWTVQNLFSIVQLYLTRDKPIAPLTKTHAPAGGKGRGKKDGRGKRR